MLDRFRQLLRPYIDPTSLLALLTVAVFIGLYIITQAVPLLIASLPYAVLGLYGVLTYRPPQATKSAIMSDDGATPRSSDEMTTHLQVTVDGLVRAAHAINDVTAQQSTSVSEQADLISRTNQWLENYLSVTERISEQVRHINQVAQETADMSEQGQQAIRQSIQTIDDIRVQVEVIGKSIAMLANLTRRIDAIITSVSEIATQSNLLALNASIEAARAGTQGRGFAVVADEVRSLAQQSTQSASQVRAILIEIQQAMKETVLATQTGMANVDAGVQQTQDANAIVSQLSQSVKASREAVRDIYTIIREQADTIEEISINMDRVDRITQQNLSNTRTVDAVSSNLRRLAADLLWAVNHEGANDANASSYETGDMPHAHDGERDETLEMPRLNAR